MTISENTKYILVAIAVAIFGLIFAFYTYSDELIHFFAPTVSKEVHVHADFLFYILGERIDLTADKYQSSTGSIKHPDMHFHDNIDTMLHRHAEGITLGEFMQSIGISLTDPCVTLNTKETFCADEENELRLFVNGENVVNPSSYVIKEEDQLLLYYGDPATADITQLLESVSDEACIYSGTCPERGEPPFETCGITCEI